jgi:hypothetical protein
VRNSKRVCERDCNVRDLIGSNISTEMSRHLYGDGGSAVSDDRSSVAVVADQTCADAAAVHTTLKTLAVLLQTERLPTAAAVLVGDGCHVAFCSDVGLVFGFKGIRVSFQHCFDSRHASHASDTAVVTLYTPTILATHRTTGKALAISVEELIQTIQKKSTNKSTKTNQYMSCANFFAQHTNTQTHQPTKKQEYVQFQAF